MSHISFIFYVNKLDDKMREISSRNILIWSGSHEAKTWDNVLVKLDHLTDREPCACTRVRDNANVYDNFRAVISI